MSPDHGPIIGGATVTITGSGFTAENAGDAGVMVGEFLATDVTVVDDGTITFTLPAGIQEGSVVDVVVFNQNGIGSLDDSFQYNERPMLISVDPAFGSTSGGSTITITGRGFEDLEAGAAIVTVGGVAATSATVVDDQTITAVLGANTSAEPFTPVDVEVSNLNGSDTLEGEMQLTGQGIITIDRQSKVYFVHPTSGRVTQISRAPRKIHACSRTASGSLVVQSLKPDGSAMELANFDPLSGTVSVIGATNDGAAVNRSIHSFAFTNGTLYGITSRQDRQTSGAYVQGLASVNVSTAATTPIGAATGLTQPVGLAPRDAASVWALDVTTSPLRIINVADGVVSNGPALSGITPSASIHGLAVVGGTLYAVERFGQARVFSINTTTGAMSTITNIPNAQLIAACDTPSTF